MKASSRSHILSALLVCAMAVAATGQQIPTQMPPNSQTVQNGATDINSLLGELQRVSTTAIGDIAGLRIEKWKADNNQKQQMKQVADSLERNLTNAVPGLISDVQTAPASVSKVFKLYHNMNVVYEFLNSLSEAAGAFGKGEEYESLAHDAAALENIRQGLSTYIEQASSAQETRLQQALATVAQLQAAAQQAPPKKIVVDDEPKPPKKSTPSKTVKKTTKPATTKSTTSPSQTQSPPQ